MQTRRALVFVSAVQLAAGVAGQLIALRDRRSFDIPALRWAGSSQRVARDSWLLGTALSAPIVMLATQALCTARLAAGPSHVAARTLEGLGIAMSCGYLIEREVEVALSPRGWDPVLTPIVAAGA